MKLMIVDDEYMVREGIKHAFSWERDRIEIVAEAGDGKSAIAKAVQTQPDIIICDIRMPFMDGLTFVKQVQTLMPDAGFIMLTAYSEKEYMLDAIRCGVHDFLLKPAGLEEIRATVLKVRDRIEREREQTYALRQKSELAEENGALLFDHYFSAFVRGEQNAVKVAEVMELLDGTPPMSGFLMLLLQPGSSHQWTTVQKLSEALARWHPRMVRTGKHDLILLSIEADEETKIRQVLESLQNNSKEAPCWVLSEYTEHMEELPEKYRKAGEKFDERLHSALSPARQAEEKSSENAARNSVPVEEISGHLGRALRYIQSHYDDPDLQLEDAAKALYLSTAYLSRIMNENDGKGFVGWLRYFRIEKAKELLENTNLKFFEISEKVGYKSYKVFSEHFTRETGLTIGSWKHEKHPGQKSL